MSGMLERDRIGADQGADAAPAPDALIEEARRRSRRRRGIVVLATLAAAGGAIAAQHWFGGGSSLRTISGHELAPFLARPVTLPTLAPGAPCPTSPILHAGAWDPYPFAGSGTGYLQTADGRLFAMNDQVVAGRLWAPLPWEVRASYRGPLLIRVRRLDGPSRSIRLWQANTTHPNYLWWPSVSYLKPNLSHGYWGLASSVSLPSTGCLGFQLDGANFSEHVIVQTVYR